MSPIEVGSAPPGGPSSAVLGVPPGGAAASDSLILAASTIVAEFLATFVEFPPRQKAASFTIDQVVAKLESVITSGR